MRRRLGLSRAFSSEAPKRSTLDSKTFKECSTRMMRFAPTLDRRRGPEKGSSQSNIEVFETESTDNHKDADVSKNDFQNLCNAKVRLARKSFEETCSDSDDDDVDGETADFEEVDLTCMTPVSPASPPPSPSTFPANTHLPTAIQTLTMTSCGGEFVGSMKMHNKEQSSKSKHSTLPSSIQKYFTRATDHNGNGTGSTRSNTTLWMKPLSRLTSFMSNIGNNIDVASHYSL